MDKQGDFLMLDIAKLIPEKEKATYPEDM